MGHGGGGGLSWTSKDWGDGKGYRAKIHFLPDGWTEEQMDVSNFETFAEWASGYYGGPIVTQKELDEMIDSCSEEPKYGYILVDDNQNVLSVIRRTNPNAQWDWYQVGGRWSGFLKLKPNCGGSVGEKNWMVKGDPPPDHVDSARKGDIDFEGMMADSEARAAETYDKARALIDPHLEDFVDWETVRENQDDIKTAREVYGDQEAVKAFRSSKEFGFFSSVEDFLVEREVYLETARNSSFVTFALLINGEWFEKGSMGWWGMASDEKDQGHWNREFTAKVMALPDDTQLTVVDCHI